MSKRWLAWRIVIMSVILLMSFVLLFSYEVFVSSKALYREKVVEIEKTLAMSLGRLVQTTNLIEFSDSIRHIAKVSDTSRLNRDIYDLYFQLIPGLYRIGVVNQQYGGWQKEVDSEDWTVIDSLQIVYLEEKFVLDGTRFRWSKYYQDNGEQFISCVLQNKRDNAVGNMVFFDFKVDDIHKFRNYKYIDKESFGYITTDNNLGEIGRMIIPFSNGVVSDRNMSDYDDILNAYFGGSKRDTIDNDGIVEFEYNNKAYYVSNSVINFRGDDVEFGVVLAVKELVQEYRTSSMAISVFLFIVFAVYLYVVISSYVRYRREMDKEDSDVSRFIRKGESSTVEFKSSLRWDYVENKPNKALEDVIMKTIAAFNNSDGGRLFIGVKDDGTALGLLPDYGTLKGGDKDYFELHLRSLITAQYGMEFCSNGVVISFPIYDGVEICEVKVRKGIVPIYSAGKAGGKDERFYIRSGNSSREIDKPSEIIDYIHKHWKMK